MSMDRCQRCSELVDTDAEPECYIQELPDGSEIELDGCRCESCRSRHYDNVEHHGYSN